MRNLNFGARANFGGNPSYFNVSYGKASISITGTAAVIISTTQAAFHGMGIITTGTEPCTVFVYDSTGSASGNIVGMITLPAATSTQWDLNTPTMAKFGLVATKTGTASKVSIFYGPKG